MNYLLLRRSSFSLVVDTPVIVHCFGHTARPLTMYTTLGHQRGNACLKHGIGTRRIHCYTCGGSGHYARNCPKSHLAICGICGGRGHLPLDCPVARHTVFPFSSQRILRCGHAGCFARRIVLCSLRKHLFAGKSSSSARRIRHDLLARMIVQALFLGHGVRHNVIFEVWAAEGIYRLSANDPVHKLHPNETFLISHLQKHVEPESYYDGHPITIHEGTADCATRKNSYDVAAKHAARAILAKEQSMVLLTENAGSEFEDFVLKPERTTPQALSSLEMPIVIGDHDYDAVEDLFGGRPLRLAQDPDGDPLGEQCFWQEPTSRIIPLRLRGASRLASSCVAIVHYVLDKLHCCPLKLWTNAEKALPATI